jgi:hypothetical protein
LTLRLSGVGSAALQRRIPNIPFELGPGFSPVARQKLPDNAVNPFLSATV